MRSQGIGKSVEELCGLFGYSRQHYYQQAKRLLARNEKEALILEFVRSVRENQKYIGTLKLQHMWNSQTGVSPIGRDALFKLLGRHNLLVRKRRRYRPKLTDGNGKSIYADYRKVLKVDRPSLLWCSDTTYMELLDGQRWIYLTCVTDEYSHLIVGYVVSESLEAQAILPAYQQAVDRELPAGQSYFEQELYSHTDRAAQYKSKLYIDFTDRYHITRSMAGAGKSHENPVAERLNGILKNELLVQSRFHSLEQAREEIAKAVHIYNERRPHLSCNLNTPLEAHHKKGVLKKLWRQRQGKRH